MANSIQAAIVSIYCEHWECCINIHGWHPEMCNSSVLKTLKLLKHMYSEGHPGDYAAKENEKSEANLYMEAHPGYTIFKKLRA